MLWSSGALVLALVGTAAAGPVLPSRVADEHLERARRGEEINPSRTWALFQDGHILNTEAHWKNAIKFDSFEPTPIDWMRDPKPETKREELEKRCQEPCQGNPVDIATFIFDEEKVKTYKQDKTVDDYIKDLEPRQKGPFPTLCLCEKISDDDFSKIMKTLNELPDVVRTGTPIIAIRNVETPNNDSKNKVVIVPKRMIGDTSAIFQEALAVLFTPEVKEKFEKEIAKDICVARKDALDDTKKAFIYAAVLYQSLWRAPFMRHGIKHPNGTRAFHNANLSCMYFQLRAVGDLVYKEGTADRINRSYLYPHEETVEVHAVSEQTTVFRLTEMPCAVHGGKISIEHGLSDCKQYGRKMTDPEVGKLITGNGELLSKKGTIITPDDKNKKNYYNPGRPKCEFTTHGNAFPDGREVTWAKTLKFDKSKNGVPRFDNYSSTFITWEMEWSDGAKQSIRFSLYPAAACEGPAS
ncbi:hypothetical protein CXG81DRAFT_21379 [Caulochytrium protostelioides]|uniref:Uncharacterized protein n=1 Tax=Caulochytrium protostelioides TaxID=1555241 RepID=A0A4P9WV29_9FUNG|nr:hypothetical protein CAUPRSCDRAFT_11076 [Caulochytrium protostelioides]RKO98380.1 hypothetical protein CXG81DRAFT_21379 [Caulochytrium protostelioides]|eukprot:RKO98380.1 hypothetical protein CXG81DRAFT_21379 [Caulochytrium protostelioides]